MIGEYRRRRFFFFLFFFLTRQLHFRYYFRGRRRIQYQPILPRSVERVSSLSSKARRGEKEETRSTRGDLHFSNWSSVESSLMFFFSFFFFFCFLRRNTSSSPSSKNSGRFDSGLANWKFLGLPRKRFGFRRFRLEIDSVTVIPLAIAFFLPDTIAVTYGAQMWNLLSRKRTTTFGLIVYRYRTIVCLCQRNKLETSNGTYT